jgi:hypothetical protein
VRIPQLFTVTALLLFGATSDAAAQQPLAVVPRADLAGFVGWQHARVTSDGPYGDNEWYGNLLGGVSSGWHWTPHWKTELDAGASTEASAYRTERIVLNGRQAIQPSLLAFSRRTLGVSQQYQFFRNAWVHPHVAAGVNLTWERRIEHFEHPVVFEGPQPPAATLPPRRTEGPVTDFTYRPFIAGGVKLYFTERAFFRSDIRFAFRDGLDETHTRFGFGFDF